MAIAQGFSPVAIIEKPLQKIPSGGMWKRLENFKNWHTGFPSFYKNRLI